MPRDSVTITNLTSGAAVATPAGTTITPANGAVIPDVGDTSRLLVRVTNTNGTQRTVTFKAGANPPASRKGLGDLAVVVPATSGDRIVALESGRFTQADGSVLVDFETSMAGAISAIRLPKAA